MECDNENCFIFTCILKILSNRNVIFLKDKNKREDRGCDTPRYSSDGELENLWKNIIYDCCVHTTAFLLCISIILITLITGYLLSNY